MLSRDEAFELLRRFDGGELAAKELLFDASRDWARERALAHAAEGGQEVADAELDALVGHALESAMSISRSGGYAFTTFLDWWVRKHLANLINPPPASVVADQERVAEAIREAALDATEISLSGWTDDRALVRFRVPKKRVPVVWRKLRKLNERLDIWPIVGDHAVKTASSAVCATLSASATADLSHFGPLSYEEKADEKWLLSPVTSPPKKRFVRVPKSAGDLVAITVFPTSRGHEVPAFDPWLERWPPEKVVALFRRWSEVYGAELCMFGLGGAIELVAKRPPITRADAYALAQEHRVFNSEIEPPTEALADRLLADTRWAFWFD